MHANKFSFSRAIASRFALLVSILALAACIAASPLARAGDAPAKLPLNVPADTLENATKALSRQSGANVIFPTKIATGVRTKAVKGDYTVREALDIMLDGTGLVAEQDEKTGSFTVRKKTETETPEGRVASGRTGDFFVSARETAPKNQNRNDDEGSIHGTVINDTTTEMLEGAGITLMPSARRASAAHDGTFSFDRVPAGDARLIVSYPGLATREIPLTVAAGKVSEAAVRLKDDNIVQMSAFVVQGTKEGMSKAQALQQSADNMMSVVAADQFGDYSGNMGDYLQFIPGVAPDDADGRSVSLRGLPSFLTNVTIDSMSVASAASGIMSRVTELQVFSLSNVETIEIMKTLTPDLPATDTGGSINMISKSAFDRENSGIKYRAFLSAPYADRFRVPGVNSGENMTSIRPNFELDITRRIGRNLGLYVGARAYESTSSSQRGVWAYNFNPQYGGLPNDPTLSEWTLRADSGVAIRRSASARLDWKISPQTKWSFAASWNAFENNFYRDYLNFYWNPAVNNLRALSSTDAPQNTMSTGNVRSARNTSGTEAGYVDVQVVSQRKNASTSTYSTTFESVLNSGGVLKAVLYYNTADNTYRDITDGHFGQTSMRISNVLVQTNTPGALVPNLFYTKNNAPLWLNDITNFRVLNGVTEPNTANEIRYGGQVSFIQKLPLALATTIKVGAQWDATERSMDRRYFYTQTNPLIPAGNAAAMLSVRDDVRSALPGALGFPAAPAIPDLRKLRDLYPDSLTRSSSNNFLAAFNDTDTALYARVDFKPGEDWLIIAGVRDEKINNGNWNKLTNDRGSLKYDNQFWSLNAKYTPSRKHVFRAAITQSMGLPDYTDLLPSSLTITEASDTDTGRGTVEIGNPNLKPYEVLNLDLSYAYNFRKTGFASIALFRKAFKNYIIEGTQALTDQLAASIGLDTSALSQSVENYDLVTRFNIKDKGYYNGIELSAGDQLTFLPKPFDTLGIQANLTLIGITPIKTGSVLVSNDPAQNAAMVDQVNKALKIGAMPVQANLVVNWRYRKLAFLAAIRYMGRTLRGLSQQTIQYSDLPTEYMNALTYSERRSVVDFKVEYRWKQYLTPYIQIRNLFNASSSRAMNGYLLYKIQTPGPTIEAGVRGQF